jgi:hypothetical protein
MDIDVQLGHVHGNVHGHANQLLALIKSFDQIKSIHFA